MANVDFMRLDERKAIVESIESEENISRKRYEQRKFDIYHNRQAPYVLERLYDEFSPKTVQRMRKVLSINPCKRIIDQKGSIYAQEPERHFSNVTNERMSEGLENLYHYAHVDEQMRLANRYYKLHFQCALWCVPKNNKIMVRALPPMYYDVVPDENDPEKAFAYIINIWDRDFRSSVDTYGSTPQLDNSYYQSDRQNQKIADDSDRQIAQGRYVIWTPEMHMTVDGYGDIIGEVVPNPIGRLPFIDVASEKDFQFFVRRGNAVPEFTIDLLTQISDLAEVSRLQGYSQGIVYSVEEPKDVVVGPNKIIWLKQPADASAPQPKFEFVSPSPDLDAGLSIVNAQLKMFLSSEGLDPNTVTGSTEARAFSSGIDHLLSNIDKFKASSEDMDLFRRIETELFDVMRLWSNEMQSVTDESMLVDELRFGQIPDDVKIEVKFTEPQSVRTQSEVEDSVIKRLEQGLLTKADALKELYGYDDDKADEYLESLEKERDELMRGMNESAEGDQANDRAGNRPQGNPGGGLERGEADQRGDSSGDN
jgi:hypothetical protein